jgi:hypothetical protein
MVSTPKGSNHVRDVPFTYIFMYYFPNRPLNPTMKQDGFKNAVAIYVVKWL